MNKLVYLSIIIIALGAVYFLFPQEQSSSTEVTTLEEAVLMAREENKLVFLYINSQNCPYCRMLEEEFSESEEFQRVIHEEYIWITLDFTKNLNLARRFGLQGPPAMIILDQNGTAITGIPGYPPEGVRDVIAMLKEVSQ
ncbi:MAG: thioredoxin family protein [Theionarchaea archaeon]|nr:thioredoxin family protein [Theionarchaea archaeon]MBU7000397.1 thioredoxin family protein [Theionarchaea archaeon]MBU7021239.1 thioredoxin family protein [Theionarchaea archaeon]MBU7036007.1 thioredoxin family protein [Theionarchaea archaeon]MBU7039731.1 thioredoxin family protein [Theionarchaea archaeon]